MDVNMKRKCSNLNQETALFMHGLNKGHKEFEKK